MNGRQHVGELHCEYLPANLFTTIILEIWAIYPLANVPSHPRPDGLYVARFYQGTYVGVRLCALITVAKTCLRQLE